MATAKINYADLIDLHDNYVKDKWPLLSAPIKKDDTKSVWFEMNQELRDSLNDILADPAVNGIRFYFTAYPNSYPTDPNIENRLSIGYVATIDDNGKTVDDPTGHSPMNHPELSP
ncbi:MAG: hypothetical protein WAT19_15600 [Ferruginibacter sp.]